MEDKCVKINLLDGEFWFPIADQLKRYSVGFYEQGPQPNDVDIVGTGTFVKVKGNFAILTVAHIVDRLKGMDRIGLIVGDNFRHKVSLDPKKVQFQVIAFNPNLTDENCLGGGPDLALIRIDQQVAATLERGPNCVFYNLEKATHTQLALHRIKEQVRLGTGYLAKHIRKSRKQATVTVIWAPFGGEISDQHRRYWKPTKQWFDYFWLDVGGEFSGYRMGALEKEKFKGLLGVSGGAVFLIPFRHNKKTDKLLPLRPLLAGVNFAERVTSVGGGELQFSEKCHGPNTIQLVRKILELPFNASVA